jgi:hypothetical protein
MTDTPTFPTATTPISFGTIILLTPMQLASEPSLAQRFETWRLAVRDGRAHPCLFCHCRWRAGSEPPHAFVALRDDAMAPLSPVCAPCAGSFSDADALMDQACIVAKHRWWPSTQRVSVGQVER